MPAVPSQPLYANFPSELLTQGAGVAIFHLASARVVVCFHTRDKYYFLPKGRLNAGEDARIAAEREGFEESGYRNRVLPLPMKHRQPVETTEGDESGEFASEAVWMQLLPLSRTSQYVLFWFVAETVPEEVERTCSAVREDGKTPYVVPERFSVGKTLRERMAGDVVIGADGSRTAYEPVRHEGTGVDEEEALYTSELVPVEEAIRKLGKSVMADVVKRGWDGIQLRLKMEERSEGRASIDRKV